MRLAIAQMKMEKDIQKNTEKILSFIKKASEGGADLIAFPELSFSPFFPAQTGKDASAYLMDMDDPAIFAVRKACQAHRMYVLINAYLKIGGKAYDACLMIDDADEILGISTMQNIFSAPYFFETEYYTPGTDGFSVYETPFGKIGVVICFDRHIPGSVRGLSKRGVELILIPTANLTSEAEALYAWEMRVQAFENTVFLQTVNRTGEEGAVSFCCQSILAGPDGTEIFQADEKEKLFIQDIDFRQAASERKKRDWLKF